ncbi:MAG: site-specific DNA-methyltransferase [Betaproteobacteria bacterium]|nr:site-specific DNA-methyltransferase [Betaproteobacteria bacterium]
MAKPPKSKLTVEALKHDDATRKNIPTAEYQSVMHKEEQSPLRVAYERRNTDLDPQLVWRGKDQQDWSDLVVHAPPIYIQEKIHPKVLIDDLRRRSEAGAKTADTQVDMFADFNGLPDDSARTEFYQHDAHWANRMILGDSLQVMASLAEREGLRGKVQCIYFDPPYGIKFNSNFQWSTTSRDVKDGNAAHITREPEQVKAFRDTWRDGIHSYLTYLRDRLTVARDLLTDSGSIFVQIGDENVHRVRAVMDEVFGDRNCISQISIQKTSGQTSQYIAGVQDFILVYAKNGEQTKFRKVLVEKPAIGSADERYVCVEPELGYLIDLSVKQKRGTEPMPSGRILRLQDTTSQTGSDSSRFTFQFQNIPAVPSGKRGWSFGEDKRDRLTKSGRLFAVGKSVRWKNYHDESGYSAPGNNWTDLTPSGFGEDRIYVVQTLTDFVQRCLLMTTDPGDLVLDPTCGSGTTAYVAEQWGRRWITIDTSRVALALARARIMGARYPYYLLADSRDGQFKEAEVTRTAPSTKPTYGNLRHGFVYQRVPHITLKSIANNAEIDVIWEKFQERLEPLREQINKALGQDLQDGQDGKSNPENPVHPVKKPFLHEWEIPREAEAKWSDAAKKLHADWWRERIARQKDIDVSIAAKAESEYLYDKPYEDRKKVRVAGPFTVESLSPHRVLGVDENDELIDPNKAAEPDGSGYGERDFAQMILENLRTAGVQQAHKEDRIIFTSLTPWPGDLVCAEGRYIESGASDQKVGAGDTAAGGAEKRAAIFIGPEFGTVSRPDLVEAAREAGDAGFDVLIACAFNFEARTTDFNKLGRVAVLRARMNADLHMAEDLKNTGKGNLFVIFGEPDIEIMAAEGGQVRVKVQGVDVFDPSTGEVRSDGADGIACWFIDTDYNEESFFVRHAYFLGANDPYKSLKTTLKAEINEDAWATLNSDTSRPFDKPTSGRIAVKVINHLGDEVMKVFRI